MLDTTDPRLHPHPPTIPVIQRSRPEVTTVPDLPHPKLAPIRQTFRTPHPRLGAVSPTRDFTRRRLSRVKIFSLGTWRGLGRRGRRFGGTRGSLVRGSPDVGEQLLSLCSLAPLIVLMGGCFDHHSPHVGEWSLRLSHLSWIIILSLPSLWYDSPICGEMVLRLRSPETESDFRPGSWGGTRREVGAASQRFRHHSPTIGERSLNLVLARTIMPVSSLSLPKAGRRGQSPLGRCLRAETRSFQTQKTFLWLPTRLRRTMRCS